MVVSRACLFREEEERLVFTAFLGKTVVQWDIIYTSCCMSAFATKQKTQFSNEEKHELF